MRRQEGTAMRPFGSGPALVDDGGGDEQAGRRRALHDGEGEEEDGATEDNTTVWSGGMAREPRPQG
jgi:hypothetical protein